MTRPVVKGSIRRRLLLLLFCASAILAVLLYFVVQTVARQVAQQSQDNILAASAISVLDSARSVNGAITVDLPYAALSMLDSVTDERVFYAVRLGQDVLTGYPDLPRPPLTNPRQTGHMSARFLGDEIRVAAVGRPFSTDSGREILEVSVAQTLSGQTETLARSSRMALAIGAGFFALGTILALIVARTTVKPLDRLTESVSRRGPADLRPVSAPVPQEMAPLVASLNGFMQRLGASLDRSEDFIAEAAHRVRTPLAVVRTKAEIIQRNVEKPENRDAIQDMIHAIDESSRTAGQLLDHAMVSFRLENLADDDIDFRGLVVDTVERLRPVSEIKGIDLRIAKADAASLKGDAILLQNAVRNLLDNAIKYSPSGTTIDIALGAQDDAVQLDVSDAGPGFPDTKSDALIKRFARGENAEGVIGSGLGLTIVKDVMTAHGGTLNLKNNPGGGGCATMLFPLS